MSVETVGVIGGGTMGAGIAQVFAMAGLRVVLVENGRDLLDRAVGRISSGLDRLVVKSAIGAADKVEALARITPAQEVEAAARAGLVIEAVPESLPLKKEVFVRLDRSCPPETILATNTSSLPITAIASATRRADRVVGMHFMNPVPVMKLVELIRGHSTSEATFQAARELTLRLGKTPVSSQDYPGFIANRVLMPMINEAAFALMEGVGTREDIDAVMRLGMNHPMGPLQLADFIGLDVCLSILETLQEGLGDPKYRPCPLLRRLVQAGRLGRKSGHGFYDHAAA